MTKKKIYIGLVIILIIVALALLFSGKIANQKGPEQEDTTPITTNIPDNMAISDEIGG
ncbi:MAG TPA: hypothetical protein P5274_03020 [Candidatus Paceibacterota bacterium]|nr:hypothetical protein [Candidatus Paceibacterota bacterium]